MPNPETFVFGELQILPHRREALVRGVSVPLGSRAFDLLLALVRRRGQLATTDELMTEVWPGTVVEDNNLKVQISAIRKILRDVPGSESWLVTIPGRGYRFVAPVADEASAAISDNALRSSGTGEAAPDKPSIAVLPFTNLSGDPEQDYFADGIVEDIITALSRVPSLFVIARNSSFTYKGRAADVRAVGRELGVRYVLEGSVRKAGSRVRVTGQLVEAEAGNHLWAERYEHEISDIFALQDEMTADIVGALVPSVERAEMRRASSKPARSPTEGRRGQVDAATPAAPLKSPSLLERSVIDIARTQRITFCRTTDGVSIAVARVGRGTPIICPPTWGTHLEYDWESPFRAQLWGHLAKRFELIRYDGRGFGLSDRNVPEISLETLERDLEAVVSASGVDRFAFFCASTGSPAAIAHAARYPERVSRMVIHDSVVEAIKTWWPADAIKLASGYAAFIGKEWGGAALGLMRTIIADAAPGLTAEQVKWCADLMPLTTSVENAVKYFTAFTQIDVTDQLPNVRASTLVLHCRHCRTMPLQQGLRTASSIPRAGLVSLESQNLIPIPGDPAWPVFLETVEEFLSEA